MDFDICDMSVSYEDEDRPFVTVLQSMGIEEFNALVPVALNEYAASKFDLIFLCVFIYFGYYLLWSL